VRKVTHAWKRNPWADRDELCTGVGVHDVITSANFYDCRLWGLSVVGGEILGFSIDLRRRPYNTLCDWRGSGLGEHPKKIWDSLFISATFEASD